MLCPFCGDDDNRVIDSREARDGTEIRRRRECDECGRRFTTRERVEEVLPRVIKHDERREEDDRTKLLRGIEQLPAKTVAEMLGIAAAAVDKRYSRALTRLRKKLGDSVFDEID